jgi:hypothetical protein
MVSRTQPGPANLRHREATLRILRCAGFSVAAVYVPAAEFEVGIGLILDALEGLRSGRNAPHALARNIAATNAPKPPNS